MYSVDSLEYAVRHLFQGGIGEHGYSEEEVETLLHGIDFEALLQAVRHKAKTVHTYTTQDNAHKHFNYRSGELFGQRATRLYEDVDQTCYNGDVLTGRTYELWLLEDMSLVSVACVSLDCGDGEYVTEYREIKEGDPWDSPMYLDLDELVDEINAMCAAYYESDIPLYEL